MDTELMLDVGQANELKLAFRRHGWTNGEIKKLCEDDILAHLLPFVREYGKATVAMIPHVIDCDVDPFIPISLKGVAWHNKGGQFAFDSAETQFYYSPLQWRGKEIKGTDLKIELANQPVLNANVLDYLLAHPILIPNYWRGSYVFFWGTGYHDSNNHLYVRYLYKLGGKWLSSDFWLGRVFDRNDRAVVRVN